MRYISDAIQITEYSTWLNGEKILISAPTGAGKTTFVTRTLLPYCASRGKKMLILCNRRLLKMQYGYDFAEDFTRYEELAEAVEVSTYQTLSEMLRDSSGIKNYLKAYDIIICDEVHYFYADSDFNGEGTYVLLQALIQEGFLKCMVMITATLAEVRPLIEKTFEECRRKVLRKYSSCSDHYFFKGKVYDFETWADYERFECLYAPDVETLAMELACSDKKTLVFMDDKNKAEQFKTKLVTAGIKEESIFQLNAQIMDEKLMHRTIQNLVVRHKLIVKVLITTSVLDNGVSIHDPQVGNVVIATDSRVSLIQMIGRVRAESTEKCKIFFFPRSVEYFGRRLSQYEEKINMFNELEKKNLANSAEEILRFGWFERGEKAEMLRNMIVLTDTEWEYYAKEKGFVYVQRDGLTLAINAFAKEKAGNMFLMMENFYRQALDDPMRVVEEQMAWLGKKPQELCVMDSSYLKKRKEELKIELLEIKNFSLEELKEAKANLAQKFRKDLLGNRVKKNGSFSSSKLEEICEELNLRLVSIDGDDQKKRYTVVEREGKRNEKNEGI